MNLTVLYEKIASLPPSLLPVVEQFVDSLPTENERGVSSWEGNHDDPDWGPPPVDENGKRIHPKAGCMKGIIVMHDNFFEPDDVWEEYM
jgi:hypothetical protein